MLEIFTTTKYDNKIAVTDGEKNYTFSEIKQMIASFCEKLKSKKENIVILSGDNFGVIIKFFAGIFCDKNIYLLTDRARLKDLKTDFDLIEDNSFGKKENYKFPEINVNKPCINFFTSGSTGVPKIIKKSLRVLITEGKDLCKEFQISGDYTVLSTTSMCHLFGMTGHLMFPFCNGFKISTQNISYPENVNCENAILVSTPSFLSSVLKHNLPFNIAPKYILSAGSKLDNDVFEYLEKKSKIIEIYGSSETGIIAHKTHFSDKLKLFSKVNVTKLDDKVEISSDYIWEGKYSIYDNLEINGREITIKNRTDRLFKIYEKRVSADELEGKLKYHDYVTACYITKHDEKLVCLCALSPEGKDYLIHNGVPSLTKTLKKYMLNFSEIIPQRWKYIDEIPRNQMGKTDKQTISNMFDTNISLPVILNRKIDADSIIYEIFFYKSGNFFKGHFPEFPLVPGVMQLYLAKYLANTHFNLDLGQGQWKRIKFSNIIEPDSIIKLKLEKTEKSVSYEYYSDEKKYASGVFLCENIFKGVLK